MIDEVFRRSTEVDGGLLKIYSILDGEKVVDARSSRLTYVADPVNDKDAINKSWAIKYFKDEKDAIAKLGESVTAKSAELDTKATLTLNMVTTSLNEIKAILSDFKGKQTELNALKSSLEALKGGLEKLEITGVVNDTDSNTNQTYSSKKIEGLIEGAKTTLANDIKSKTDSLTSSLNNLSFSTLTALEQKANKKDVPSVASLESVFLKKTDQIDAYTKEQSNSTFAKIDQVIGVNQATKVVTTQRAFNVFYENTTDKPIMLYIDAWNNGVIIQLALNVTIGDVALSSSNTATTSAATHTNITVLIPPKTRYKVTSNGALYSWIELS